MGKKIRAATSEGSVGATEAGDSHRARAWWVGPVTKHSLNGRMKKKLQRTRKMSKWSERKVEVTVR